MPSFTTRPCGDPRRRGVPADLAGGHVECAERDVVFREALEHDQRIVAGEGGKRRLGEAVRPVRAARAAVVADVVDVFPLEVALGQADLVVAGGDGLADVVADGQPERVLARRQRQVLEEVAHQHAVLGEHAGALEAFVLGDGELAVGGARGLDGGLNRADVDSAGAGLAEDVASRGALTPANSATPQSPVAARSSAHGRTVVGREVAAVGVLELHGHLHRVKVQAAACRPRPSRTASR